MGDAGRWPTRGSPPTGRHLSDPAGDSNAGGMNRARCNCSISPKSIPSIRFGTLEQPPPELSVQTGTGNIAAGGNSRSALAPALSGRHAAGQQRRPAGTGTEAGPNQPTQAVRNRNEDSNDHTTGLAGLCRRGDAGNHRAVSLGVSQRCRRAGVHRCPSSHCARTHHVLVWQPEEKCLEAIHTPLQLRHASSGTLDEIVTEMLVEGRTVPACNVHGFFVVECRSWINSTRRWQSPSMVKFGHPAELPPTDAAVTSILPPIGGSPTGRGRQNLKGFRDSKRISGRSPERWSPKCAYNLFKQQLAKQLKLTGIQEFAKKAEQFNPKEAVNQHRYILDGAEIVVVELPAMTNCNATAKDTASGSNWMYRTNRLCTVNVNDRRQSNELRSRRRIIVNGASSSA